MSRKKALEALDRNQGEISEKQTDLRWRTHFIVWCIFDKHCPLYLNTRWMNPAYVFKSSVLWRHLQKLTLKINMRTTTTGCIGWKFCKTINGYYWRWANEIYESTQCIILPANFCKITESLDELVQKVFPNIAQLQKPSVAQYACYISSQKHRCQYHQLHHSAWNTQ
ncbi:hypothetical protein TNCV_15801 [Trichonephila clavipes]|nr:hypothetical protein TNCV_15801 [Trichonephila clavipes]